MCKRLKTHYFNTQIIILDGLPLVQCFLTLTELWNLLGSIKNINSKATNPPPTRPIDQNPNGTKWLVVFQGELIILSKVPYCKSFISIALTRKLHYLKLDFMCFPTCFCCHSECVLVTPDIKVSGLYGIELGTLISHI